MRRNGFGLLEIVIVIAIIALLFGGASFLVKKGEEQKTLIQTGQRAEEKALELKRQLELQSKVQQKTIDLIEK